MKILRTLEEGKLSAEEASRLLRALSKGRSEALKAGLTGKIVDVIDEGEGRQVEIYVE
ncbi:MAG: hypothetical protein ACE5M4_04960 [Anaerolineales bacterium]